jgi:hypothetical protein
MPEKVNFNKSQKDKQIKILNYYKKNLIGQSIKEVPKPIKKTRKHAIIQEKLTKKQEYSNISSMGNINKDISKKNITEMKIKQIVEMD